MQDELRTDPPSDEWRQCSYQSNRPIAGIFVVFKTPLSSTIQHPPDCRFTPKSILDSIRIQGGKISMWIDATPHETNFYSSDEVTDRGTSFVKFGICEESDCNRSKCGRHVNSRMTVNFNQISNEFLQSRKSPQHYIGIHCSLGYNVCGYFICTFLIQHMGFTLEGALAEFSSCRPNGINNQQLLNDLIQRFGKDKNFVFEPRLPPKMNSEVDRTVKEKKALEPKFVDGVQGVIPVQDKAKLLKLQRKVQNICKWSTDGFPGSILVTLNSENISLLKEREYWVSHKTVGKRYIMFIQGNKDIYFVDKKNYFFQVLQDNLLSWEMEDTLIDGEFIVNKNGQAVFIMFDIISYDGNVVKDLPFRLRHDIIKDIMSERRAHGFPTQNIQLEEAITYRMPGLKDMLENKSKLNYETDGLIFTPPDSPYECGSLDFILKWKSRGLNTVDFLLRVEETNIGEQTLKIGNLYVERLDSPLGQIELNPDLEKLDGKIIECLYGNSKWNFYRHQTERVSPDMYSTAMEVVASILDPVTKEDLLKLTDQYECVDVTS